MSTVARIRGLRVVIYPNDHRPAHVQVLGNGLEAVFKLNCPTGLPELRENYRFSRPEVDRIQADMAKQLAHLCAKWGKTHGRP